ncbi:hypothetical protein PSCICJ_47920 [Pseudomonas cichorii]|nr:hypothetical protein PSCICJ_47920 [Pseudomonas cichorii]
MHMNPAWHLYRKIRPAPFGNKRENAPLVNALTSAACDVDYCGYGGYNQMTRILRLDRMDHNT